MEGSIPRHRINAALMPQFEGKDVVILGKAKDVDNNGTHFTMTTSDEQEINVSMNVPLNEYVSGLTEVHGRVQGNSIACDHYVLFSEEASKNFDLSLYNKAIELTDKCSEHYIQGVAPP